jgi:inner membrane protein
MNKILAQKAFAILVLTCVILIALFMVSSVIDDRKKYRSEAVPSIEASYAGPQVLIGPVLVRPYTQTTETAEVGENGAKKTIAHMQELTARTFSQLLDVHGAMLPSERRHGLYTVQVYEFRAS